MSCTSKWRWPSTRQAASRTVANASIEQVVEALAVVEALPELDRPVGRARRRSSASISGSSALIEGNELGQPADLLSLAGPQDLREHAHEARSLPPDVPAQRRISVRACGPAGGRRVSADPGPSGRGRQALDSGAGTRRGWERPTSLPFIRSTWCSSLSTTWSTATSASRAGGPGPHGVAVAGDGHLAHLPAPTRRRPVLGEAHLGPLEHGGQPAEPGHLRLCQRPHFVGHSLLASAERTTSTAHLLQAAGRGARRRRSRLTCLDACGPRPADLVFDPTLACRGVGGPVAGGRRRPRSPTRPGGTHDGRLRPFSAGPRQPAPRRAGLTSKSHHAQQPRVALRGSFRLRLASTCNHRPGRSPHVDSVRLRGSECPGVDAML